MLIGSDTIPLPGSPHPRTAGTFARILGTYVRDERVTDWPRTVRRMTSVPVERFGLGPRGRQAAGLVADVAVFEPDGVQDRATYTDPHAPPRGWRMFSSAVRRPFGMAAHRRSARATARAVSLIAPGGEPSVPFHPRNQISHASTDDRPMVGTGT